MSLRPGFGETSAHKTKTNQSDTENTRLARVVYSLRTRAQRPQSPQCLRALGNGSLLSQTPGLRGVGLWRRPAQGFPGVLRTQVWDSPVPLPPRSPVEPFTLCAGTGVRPRPRHPRLGAPLSWLQNTPFSLPRTLESWLALNSSIDSAWLSGSSLGSRLSPGR